MADVPQILNELIRRLTQMRDVHATLSAKQQQSAMDRLMLTSIDKWTRGSGSMFGYLAEFAKYHKHMVLKNRAISNAKGTGDVVVGGQGDPFAKTIQSKAITSDAPNGVETHLIKAVEQIAGLYHENPRPGDHLVVSISIFNDVNPWPFTANELTGGAGPLAAFRDRIISSVRGAVRQAIQTGTSNSTNSLKDNLQRPAYRSSRKPGPKSPVHYQQKHDSFNFFDVVTGITTVRQVPYFEVTPTFYTKVSWPFGYSINDNNTLRLVKNVTVRYARQTDSFEIGVTFF